MPTPFDIRLIPDNCPGLGFDNYYLINEIIKHWNDKKYTLFDQANINDIYKVNVISINKIGILCKLYYNYNNKKYFILNAIISKNNQDSNNLNNIKINDNINVKIIGYKFSKYSKFINAICNIVNSKELEQTKKYN